MPLRLLVEGWTRYPHSYAIVNIYQLVALAKVPDVKIYYREVVPYVKEWPVLGTLVNIMLTEEEDAVLKSIETYTEGTPIDIVYRISFAHNLTPCETRGVPVVVFYTAEFQKLEQANFAPGTGDFVRFVELMKKGRMAAITPSEWSKGAFTPKQQRKVGNFLKVIPHGVDVGKFYPDPSGRKTLRQGLGIDAADIVFLNIGAMTGNKNILGILKAFYELCQKKDNVRLILKGINALYECEKSVYASLQMLVQTGQIDPAKFDKSVGRKITYLDGTMGYSSMRDLYNAADCYVCPYFAEGFNMPALEAQACGSLIIMPKGGPTDDFISGDCAIVLPTQEIVDPSGRHKLVTTPADIENAMSLVMDGEMGAQMLHTAYAVGPAHVKRNFTWDKVAQKMVKYFKSLV